MSKFINGLLAFVLVAASAVASARENVTILYGFGPSDTMMTYARSIADVANKSQDKYTFLVDAKPGAGNAVAANHVLNNSNHILFTSSAFFIRPVLYPNESYKLSDFREFMPLCLGPLSINSVKYKSWSEVPKDRPVTIAVSGFGITTHLAALQLSANFPKLEPIPFKGPNDSLINTVNGTTDLGLSFIAEAEAWTGPDSKIRLNVLGVTGPKSINGHPTLHQQGLNPVFQQIEAPHHWVIPKSVSEEKFREWRAILTKATQNNSRLTDAYKVDSCQPINVKDADLDTWYNVQANRWKALASQVKLDNK